MENSLEKLDVATLDALSGGIAKLIPLFDKSNAASFKEIVVTINRSLFWCRKRHTID